MILETDLLKMTATVRPKSPKTIIAGMRSGAGTFPPPKYQSAPALRRKELTNAKTTTAR